MSAPGTSRVNPPSSLPGATAAQAQQVRSQLANPNGGDAFSQLKAQQGAGAQAPNVQMPNAQTPPGAPGANPAVPGMPGVDPAAAGAAGVPDPMADMQEFLPSPQNMAIGAAAGAGGSMGGILGEIIGGAGGGQ